MAPSPPRSRPPATSSTPRTTTSSTWRRRRTRTATAAWAGPASAARSASRPRRRRDVLRDDGVGRDPRARADRHPAQDRRAAIQDRAVAEADRGGGDALCAHRRVGVGEDVIEVDEDVAALQPAALADLHAVVDRDDALGPEPRVRP